jgi:hypothetical protein
MPEAARKWLEAEREPTAQDLLAQLGQEDPE